MLKKLRATHPVLYCVLAEIIFLVVLQLGGLALTGIFIALMRMGFTGVLQIDDYALDLLGEIPAIFAALALLFCTDRQRLITRRGCGFFNGVLVGMWLFAMISYNLMLELFLAPIDSITRTPVQIMWFVLSMFSVGVAEELLARGVIAQTLLEHYGPSRAGVWKACLISGAIFGAGHLINLLFAEPFGVLMQCVFTAALGVLLAAIYFRTGNLWVVIFLHTLMDVSALWEGGVYGTTTVVETVSSYDATQLYAVLVYGLPVLFILRKKKIGEVALYFGRDCKKSQ